MRVIKNNPDRLDAYERLIVEMGISSHTKEQSAAFQNAGNLLLTGAVETHHVPLLAAAIRQGNVTTEQLQNALNKMKAQSLTPLVDGLL